MRSFFALLHAALILASIFAVRHLHLLKTGNKDGFHFTPVGYFYADRPKQSLLITLCFAAGVLIKLSEDVFIPYHQGPNRPLSDAELTFRASAALAFAIGLAGVWNEIRVARWQKPTEEQNVSVE